MGKVKQAIQEVEEQVVEIVQGHGDISLPDVQTLLFKSIGIRMTMDIF